MVKKLMNGARPKFVRPVVPTADVCTYDYTDRDGERSTCRARAGCPICKQCSRISGQRETGHCTGHLGLLQHISIPGVHSTTKSEVHGQASP